MVTSNTVIILYITSGSNINRPERTRQCLRNKLHTYTQISSLRWTRDWLLHHTIDSRLQHNTFAIVARTWLTGTENSISRMKAFWSICKIDLISAGHVQSFRKDFWLLHSGWSNIIPKVVLFECDRGISCIIMNRAVSLSTLRLLNLASVEVFSCKFLWRFHRSRDGYVYPKSIYRVSVPVERLSTHSVVETATDDQLKRPNPRSLTLEVSLVAKDRFETSL